MVRSFAGKFAIRRSSQSQTAWEATLLKKSVAEQAIINPATTRLWSSLGLALTAAPMNDPVLNAARKVVIKLAQTKIELPKNGASTREATSCSPILSIPSKNTKTNKRPDIRRRSEFF